MATGGLANIESIKAGGQETALFRKWIGLQVQFVNASIRAQRLTLTLGQAPALLGLVAHLAVLGLGARAHHARARFTVGDLVAFQVLLAGFTAPVHALFAHDAEAADAARRPRAPGRRAAPQATSRA